MFNEVLLKLSKQLYPNGRAFRVPVNGFHESLLIALAKSESKANEDARAILNSILPDNADFTEDDATDWERRLGLINSPSVDLEVRKLAIKRKMNFPGTQIVRCHYLWLQKMLQDAGFNVFVHENRFTDDGGLTYYTKSPEELGGTNYLIKHGTINHGMVNHGGVYGNKVVNSIDENIDRTFAIGNNYKSTFFIGGESVGDSANVDVNRKLEFRELILKVKPVQTVAFLFINYV